MKQGYSHLCKIQPDLLKNRLIDILLNALQSLTVHEGGLHSQFSEHSNFLAIPYLLLEKDLLCLCQHQRNQRPDRIMIEICRRRMKEVLIDVGKHAGGCLERVVCCFEAGILMSILSGRVTGQNSGYVEDDRGFFEG